MRKAEDSQVTDDGGAPDWAWEQWRQPWLSGGHWTAGGFGVGAPPLLPESWGGGASPAAAAAAAAAVQNWLHSGYQWGPPALLHGDYAAATWDPTRRTCAQPYAWVPSPSPPPTPGAASSASPIQVAWPLDPYRAPLGAQRAEWPGTAHAGPDPEADTPDGKHRSWRRPTARLWCYIFLHKRHPEFDIVPMLIGRGGRNMREINTATNAKIRVRGRGSGHFEADGRGEAPVPLMVAVTANHGDADGFKQAIQMTLVRLREVTDKYNMFCQGRGLPPPSSQEPIFSIGELSKEAKVMLDGMPMDGQPAIRLNAYVRPVGESVVRPHAAVNIPVSDRCTWTTEPTSAASSTQAPGRWQSVGAFPPGDFAPQWAHGEAPPFGTAAASGEAAGDDPWAAWKPQSAARPPAHEDAPSPAGEGPPAAGPGLHPRMPPEAPPPPPSTLEPAGAAMAAAQANSDDTHNLEELIASEVSAFLNNSGADSDS